MRAFVGANRGVRAACAWEGCVESARRHVDGSVRNGAGGARER